jgi:hypothetical protein
MPFNSIFGWLMKKRIHQIDLFRKYPIEVQQEMLRKLTFTASTTEFGAYHGFGNVKSLSQFQQNTPLQSYDEIKPWVDRLLAGEKGLLWPSETKWYAQSSGTTSTRSKLIPVTVASLEDCHQKGGKDLLALYYDNRPNGKLYKYKHVIVGGSARNLDSSGDCFSGDLSAIIMKNLPWWAEIRRTPSRETALLDQWEEKIERMAQETIHEDIGLMVGVPSWTMVIAQRILDISGAKNLKEVWPNLECFCHGGVSFAPYKNEFQKLIPDASMNYVESYNASEGFFGIQDDLSRDDLLLMLDYGIFYEFIPTSHYDGINSTKVLGLEDVEPNVNYAIVISTNGGLWRYIVGDTIMFTGTSPYRFKVTGRTKSFINAFGEELIVDNSDKAVAKACEKTNAQIRDYTAAPIFMLDKSKGSHQWLFEFVRGPENMGHFMNCLDQELHNLNSDYAAKRQDSLAMSFPQYKVLHSGTFDAWLKSEGKLGGQNKVPRLANNRKIVEQLLQVDSIEQYS